MRKLVFALSLVAVGSFCRSEITGLITEPGGSDTQVQYNSSGIFQGDSDMTFNGSTLTVTGLSVTTGSITNLVPGGLTSGRVPYFNGTKLIDDSDFSFNGTTVSATGISATSMTISGQSTFGSISGGSISATTGSFSGSLSATTLNTGQGDNELFDMDQNVQTTDNPTFSGVTLTYGVGATTGSFSGGISATTLDTGNGANELYGMDQNVTTTSTPTFSEVSITYGVNAATGVFSGNVDAGTFSGDTLDTGNGANELFPMDQAVMTTSSPTFSQITAGGFVVNSTSGTGSVPFTFSSTTTIYSLRVQGRPFLDPTAPPYNAVGDGVTDDDAAIEAAWAALPDNGVLILPAGYTFLTTSGILAQKSSTTLLGLGGKILGSQKNIKIVSTNNYDYVAIENIIVQGTGKDDGYTSSGRGGIHVEANSQYCKVINNWIYQANGSGIVEDGLGDNIIEGNHILETGEHGIYLSSTINSIIKNNVIINAGINSALTNAEGYGIKIDGVENCSITGNIIRNPLTLGMQFADDAKFNTVYGNTIQMPSTAQNGIVGSGGASSFNIISANTITQANDSAAIELTANSSNYIVDGNLIYISSAATGVLVAGSSHTVRNNRIASSVASSPYGISITSHSAHVDENEIMGTGSGSFTVGINLAGNSCSAVNNFVSATTKYSDGGTNNIIIDSASGPGLDIGNSGRLIKSIYGDNTTWNPASVPAGQSTCTSSTITGVVVGDIVLCGFDPATTAGAPIVGMATGTNSAACCVMNNTTGAVDYGNGNLKIRVIRW